MRVLVVAGSVVPHIVALWWIAAQASEAPRPPRRPAGRAPTHRAPPAVIPIELAFEAVPTPRPQPARTRAPGDGARRRATATSSVAAVATSPEPRDDAPPGSPLLRMRGHGDRGAAVDLRLDAATAEHIAMAGGAAPRDEVQRSGRLERQRDGGAVVHDTVTTAIVGPDGGVTFADRPTLDVKARAPMSAVLDPEFRREVRQHVAAWLADPTEGMRYGPTQDLPRHLQGVPGACDVWGSDFCQAPDAPDFEKRWRSIKAKLRGGIGGTFDATDFLTRLGGGDPYASRKQKLLDETRAERVEMGERHRTQQLARSGELVRHNLERLWATEPDPAARRAALFELWDECGDDDAGRRARAVVLAWIRARLPRGSAHAFTDDELAALRARSTSAEPFDPYATRAPDGR